jgi:DNA-binding PadR family transcriptional regulator
MDEFNTGGLRDMLDFFILNRFSEGPLSGLEIQRRAEPIFAFLDLVAARKGKQSAGSLLTALQRLQREGLLEAERGREQPDSEMVYSLTAAGERRLKVELARRGSIVSQFVEDGELHKSFGEFLNRRRSPEGN